MTVDLSELNTLAADLTEAGVLVGVRSLKVVDASAQRIEEQARTFAPRKNLPHYAKTITHDVTVEGDHIVGEIGPDKDVNGQARLAHLFEYGTSHLAPRSHLGPALDREGPAFIAALAEIAGKIL
jgi:hypothetical protein